MDYSERVRERDARAVPCVKMQVLSDAQQCLVCGAGGERHLRTERLHGQLSHTRGAGFLSQRQRCRTRADCGRPDVGGCPGHADGCLLALC